MKMNIKELFFEQFRAWRPTEVAWLVFCLASILGLSIYWQDSALGITAALTGMLYTVLAGKGKIACFVFGIVNCPLYAYIAFQNKFYGDFALYIYYFIMMFPGLLAWGRHQSKMSEEGIVRTRLPLRGRVLLAAGCLVGVLTLSAILHLVGGNRPICDAITNVLSIAAMILTVRRSIEEWILWIIVNAVEVFMWVREWFAGNGNISVLLMWLLFLANGIYLLSLWMRIERKALARSQEASAAPTRA